MNPLQQAQSYARAGWPVVPLHCAQDDRCSCGRADCSSVGKHPITKRGLKDATTADDVVFAWWTDHPQANIGIATGAISGIVAIDVDPRHGGDVSLAELEREHGPLPATVEALTGGGGRHLIFAHPGGTVRNRSNVRPGIDVRGDGGYIVAPPSNHASGGHYCWREKHAPHEMSPAAMPAWLIALVTRANLAGRGAPDADRSSELTPVPILDQWGEIQPIAQGLALVAMRGLRVDDRNDGSRRLYAAASIAVRYGLDDRPALATIREYLRGAPTPKPYSDEEILQRLHDARRDNVPGEVLANLLARHTPERFKPFPVHELPDRIRVFVESVAAATGTETAYAALAALVVIAGCIGNRVAVLVKSGWVEPAVLWGVLVGRSGTTKSPVLKLVTRALIDLFKAERRAFTDAMKEYVREVERHNVRLAEWKKSQRNGPPTDPPDEPERPIERRLLVSDITVEKLGELLEQNPLGLLLVRDELAAWSGAFDRYAAGGKGSDQPAWLSMYDAAPVTIDRKSGKGNYFVERAAVSVLGSIQPGTLARSFGTAEREAGLLARVLVAYPPDRPALWEEAALPDDVAAEWRKLLETLLALPPAVDENGEPRPRFIPIGKEAKALWVEWHDRHARELVDISDDDLAAHYAKLKGLCARVALIFACVETVTSGEPVQYISAGAMRRAIAVAEWFKHEARRVYAVLGESREGRARRQLIEWIERRGGSVTIRDLTHSLRRYRGRPGAAKADLDALVAEGIGAWATTTVGPKGGRSSQRFVLTTDDADTQTAAAMDAKDGIGGGDSQIESAIVERAGGNGHADDGADWGEV